MTMRESEGLWVYAVIEPGAGAGRTERLTGVAGGPVLTIEATELAAVVSPVDLAEFGAEPLRRNLEQLPWLEAVARSHHQVIAAAAQAGVVVPMRLATVYRTDDALVEMLVDRAADFQAVLARIANCSEWGVKAYLSTGEAGGQTAAQPAAAVSSGQGSGADYLRRRRAQLTADEDARRSAASGAQGLHTELCMIAEAAKLHRPQDPQLSGAQTPMIMNATYLVDDRRREHFTAAVNRNATLSHSVKVEVTGPWPPYSFATTEPGP
jgi:hypothetical protein